MSRLLATALAACALLMTSTAAVDINANAYGTLAQQQEQQAAELQGRPDDHHHGHDKCRGKHREWGAFHACDCRRGSATFEKSYRDCLDVSTNPPTILPIIDFKRCECPRKHGVLSEEDEAEDDAAEADESGDADAAGRGGHHEPKPVPKPHKCEGHKDGFRFEWGAPHFCEPKDHKRCKVGEEGTTYEDCLAKDKHGNVFQTGLTRDVKCKIERCDHSKHVEVPTPKKCYGEEDGFRFEWGAPHACDPKDPKRCKVGQQGVTYRDCLAIKKKTGEVFITALNEQVKCKVERCDKKPHQPHQLYAEEDDEEEVIEADGADEDSSDDVEAADVESERHIPRPDKCYGHKDGFRFQWGAPHACDPKDPKRCKVGEKGTTYEDCLAVDRHGREFQTGLIRHVKCKVERCDNKKQVEVPTPKKCYGEEDGFRFEWGAPHACDPKDPKRCKIGQEGVTYRDCLAIKKKTGEVFITALNEEVKCKVERCDKKHGHKDYDSHDNADAVEVLAEDESEEERYVEPGSVPRPDKCYGKKDGFRFEWGAPHFCEPKNLKHCKDGEQGTTYEDCLAMDKYGNLFQTGLTRDVKCKVICNDQKHHKDIPEPPKKCYGKKDGFFFKWGAPHACDPKDPKRCRVGQEGVTYRDCLAINKKTGEQFITALNEHVKCKVERCDNKPHKRDL